jgi:glutathione synthase/RimK-type ligase-like ATP-grasp enzyme
MLVGIIGDERDIHVYTLKNRLESLHCTVDVIYFPYADMMCTNDHMMVNGRDVFDFDAFYVRAIPFFLQSQASQRMKKDVWNQLYTQYMDLATINNERIAVYTSLMNVMNDICLVINPFPALFFQHLKPFQFYLLAKHGIPVPPYLATNDVATIKTIDDSIYKPLTSNLHVEKKTVVELKKIMKERPVILQKHAKGKTIRASLLLDGLVGAAEIKHKAIDSRVGHCSYKEITLPAFVEEILLKCLQVLTMKYSEIDFIMNGDDIQILDVNPSAGFMMLEEGANIPTSLKIAEYIVRQIR